MLGTLIVYTLHYTCLEQRMYILVRYNYQVHSLLHLPFIYIYMSDTIIIYTLHYTCLERFCLLQQMLSLLNFACCLMFILCKLMSSAIFSTSWMSGAILLHFNAPALCRPLLMCDLNAVVMCSHHFHVLVTALLTCVSIFLLFMVSFIFSQPAARKIDYIISILITLLID